MFWLSYLERRVILWVLISSVAVLFSCSDISNSARKQMFNDSGFAQQKHVSSNGDTVKNEKSSFFRNAWDKLFSESHTALTYSKDGTKIITGDEKGNIFIWLTNSLKPIDTILKAHGNSITQILINPEDEKYFISFDGNSIKIWDLFSYSFVHEIPVTGNTIAISEKNILAVAGNCKIDLYHLTTRLFSKEKDYIGSAINQYSSFSSVKTLAISNNSEMMAAYSACFGLRIWRIKGVDTLPKLIHYIFTDQYTRYFGDTANIQIYDNNEVDISSLVFSRNNRYLGLIDVKNNQIVVYSTTDWTKFSIFKLKNGEISKESKLDFNSNNRYLMLTGGSDLGFIFDIEEQTEFNEFTSGFNLIDAKFNYNGNEFTTIDDGGKIRVWQTNSPLVAPIYESVSLPMPKLNLSFEPIFLPVIFSINTDGDIDITSKRKCSFIIPLGTFELNSSLNINEMIEGRGIQVTEKDIVFVFINRISKTKSEYLIKGGKGLSAEINGKAIITAEVGKITIDITNAAFEVRLRNVY